MKIPVHLRVAAGTAALLPALACANDGVAAVSAGGIVLQKTDAIAMKKEVLTVSHDLITVEYEFVNEAPSDVEETIVFPLPAYPAAQQDADTHYGEPDRFSVTVDGKPVAYRARTIALMGETDVTAELRRLGLTDEQIAYNPEFDRKVKRLTKAQWAALKNGGYLDSDSGEPAWDVQVNYIWQQKFPSRQTVRVHHAYRPFAAAGPGYSYVDQEVAAEYCMDEAFSKGYDKAYQRNGGSPNAALVSYILTTGKTWKRAIEDFTLNIVKRRPEELVSLCFPGEMRKLDNKTYQVRLHNFWPMAELKVYFANMADGPGARSVMPKVTK